MKNETACVVGIDVAKRKFDIALLINNKVKTKVFDNTAAGHKAFEEWLIERSAMRPGRHISAWRLQDLTAKYWQPNLLRTDGKSVW